MQVLHWELLIQECLAGKRSSQNELYQLLADNMFAVCSRYSGTRAEAEDILQEGFVKVFTHLHQFKHRGSFEGWVRTIMVNLALRKYRQKLLTPRQASATAPDLTVIPDTASVFARLQEKHLLQLIQQLPPVYRMVFNLYVFEGLKHKEIARFLGISAGTSKSNLHDARILLQKNLLNESKEEWLRKAI